jgi:hypothetical protein
MKPIAHQGEMIRRIGPRLEPIPRGWMAYVPRPERCV